MMVAVGDDSHVLVVYRLTGLDELHRDVH
jgi:hypothetical protein